MWNGLHYDQNCGIDKGFIMSQRHVAIAGLMALVGHIHPCAQSPKEVLKRQDLAHINQLRSEALHYGKCLDMINNTRKAVHTKRALDAWHAYTQKLNKELDAYAHKLDETYNIETGYIGNELHSIADDLKRTFALAHLVAEHREASHGSQEYNDDAQPSISTIRGYATMLDQLRKMYTWLSQPNIDRQLRADKHSKHVVSATHRQRYVAEQLASRLYHILGKKIHCNVSANENVFDAYAHQLQQLPQQYTDKNGSTMSWSSGYEQAAFEAGKVALYMHYNLGAIPFDLTISELSSSNGNQDLASLRRINDLNNTIALYRTAMANAATLYNASHMHNARKAWEDYAHDAQQSIDKCVNTATSKDTLEQLKNIKRHIPYMFAAAQVMAECHCKQIPPNQNTKPVDFIVQYAKILDRITRVRTWLTQENFQRIMPVNEYSIDASHVSKERRALADKAEHFYTTLTEHLHLHNKQPTKETLSAYIKHIQDMPTEYTTQNNTKTTWHAQCNHIVSEAGRIALLMHTDIKQLPFLIGDDSVLPTPSPTTSPIDIETIK